VLALRAPARSPCVMRALRTRLSHAWAGFISLGRTGPVLFSSVAGSWQAKRALCVWAALRFRPGGQFKLENLFSIFFQF
jgi:hypothetical protein